MRISTKGEYGLRALFDLAQHTGKGPVQSAHIAQRQQIPENYLSQLLLIMRNSGLIRSIRGPQGGHLLARDAAEINLGEVLTALEGPFLPMECVNPDFTDCSMMEMCVIRDVWREARWEQDFSANGFDELVRFQLRGQTVPNMSSALIVVTAFKRAFNPFLKRLRLTGDWLFVGDVLRQGNVEFSHAALSRFRKHEVTSRARVKSARSQAEFVLTKYHLFCRSGLITTEFTPLMASDVIRFLYEPARWWEVMKALMEISLLDTIRCGVLMVVSTAKHPVFLNKFKQRYQHARIRRKENV